MIEHCMQEFDFTLVLKGTQEITDEIADALFVAGCDDATISSRMGRPYITFSREAPSMKDAVLSAIKDVQSANVGLEVLRVDTCNLVTAAEIARRAGRPRQLIHQYMQGQRGPGGFPPPACALCDRSPLWYWCEVSYWLWENGIIKEYDFRIAQQLDMINSVLEWKWQKQVSPNVAQEVLESLG